MIKKICSICCIAVFVIALNGCTQKNILDKTNNETAQTGDVSSSDKDEVNNVESTEQAADESTNSNQNEANEESDKNEKLPDYFMQKDKIVLKGKINNKLDIHMEFQISNKKYFNDWGEKGLMPNASMDYNIQPVILYEGSYYYDQYMKNIRIEAEAFSNGYITICEFDDNNEYSGYFAGFIESGNLIKGRWDNNKGTTYQFYLAESNSATSGLDLNVDTNRIGDYYAKGSNNNDYSILLYIVAESDEKFKFHISGYSKPNMGNIGGVAYYTDESKKEAIFDDGRNCQVKFNFIDNTVKVSCNGIDGYVGAHVRLDGTFEKK